MFGFLYIVIVITGFLLYQGIMSSPTTPHMQYGIKNVGGYLGYRCDGNDIGSYKQRKKSTNAGWIQFVIAFF
ncbi:hypothetical protein GCM10020331_079380 [Ectobacillus funiculus]